MIQWIVGLLLTTFVREAFAALLKYVQGEQEKERIRVDAIAEAEKGTLEEIKETADAQRDNDARDRGGASDVAGRLRDELGSAGIRVD